MPIYEYKCEDCGHVFEEWQKDFEDHVWPCPQCEKPSKRIISNTSFVLKGSGWYVTDYGRGNGSGGDAKSKGNGNGSEKPSSKESGSDSSTQASASKAETKAKPAGS